MSQFPVTTETSFEVLLFASLREAAGPGITIELPTGSDVRQLLQEIETSAPVLAPWLPYIRVAVNCEYAELSRVLQPGDEIALLPPVSGGSDVPVADVPVAEGEAWVKVTAEPLDAAELIDWVARESKGGAGAVVPFIGIVRDNARGQSVTHLEYQAYGVMAEAEMRRISEEAALRWHCVCACAHRTGSLQIGEASLVVAVATAHRGEGFEACRWIVDEIKRRVPVWKKEYAANGSFWIEDPLAPISTSTV